MIADDISFEPIAAPVELDDLRTRWSSIPEIDRRRLVDAERRALGHPERPGPIEQIELQDHLAQAAQRRVAAEAAEERAATPRLQSAAELRPPADMDVWMVEGLLRPRSFLVVAAAEGVGKSQAWLEANIRLATGTGPLFGHYAIPGPATVCYIDEENGEAELYRRETRILGALGLDREQLERYHRVSFAGLHLSQPGRQAWLRAELARTAPDVVVLDTGGAMVDDEWGRDLKDAIRFLRSLIAEFGCAVVVLVHLVKPPREQHRGGGSSHGQALSDVLGQWARHADAVALMADLGEGRVRWSMRKRVPPSALILAQRDGLWEVVAVDDATASRAASVDDRIIRAIATGATAADEIRVALGTSDRPLPKRTLYDALARLRRDGFIEEGTPLRLTAAGDEAAS